MKFMPSTCVLSLIVLFTPLMAHSQQADFSAETCRRCHANETAHPSSMSDASARPSASKVLVLRKSLGYQDGKYKYELRLAGDRVTYEVTDGSKVIQNQIDWVIGSGKMGQAYLFLRNGSWYETQVSYYSALRGLGRMMGGKTPSDLESAVGPRLPDSVASGCFSCHTTGYVVGLNTNIESSKLTPGVVCKRCHLGAEAHTARALMGDQSPREMDSLSRLDADAVSELCGMCHRTWSNIVLNGPHGVDNVRFQPYRLANSKCYKGSDRRISCVACHDPHVPLESSTLAYDVKCLACHTGKKVSGSAPACPNKTSECVSCHMPKYALPNTHEEFTDHDIRIVKANEPYPD
jgi:hypothetical protein